MDKPVGLVLAGGLATRMGGVDKGLQTLAGRPLVAHAIERLAPQVSEVLISANRHASEYATSGRQVLADLRPDFPGPLAGIEAALARLPGDTWLQVVPCDLPRLPLDLVARLQAGLGSRPTALTAALPATAGRPQPGCCLIHASLRQSLGAYLDGGGRRVMGWLLAQGAAVIDFDGPGDAPAFLNLNTLAELHELDD